MNLNEFSYRLRIDTQTGRTHLSARRRTADSGGAHREAHRLSGLSSGVTEFVNSDGLTVCLRSRSIESVTVVPADLEEKPLDLGSMMRPLL